MKHRLLPGLILAGTLAGGGALAQTYVTPMMGGGQVAADMVHIDIYYDADANQLHAQVDDSYGTPMLRPLEPGYVFDTLRSYGVLNGRAYNSQYGWNVGGFFSLPPGAAIWIELTSSSAALETYSGWGSLGTYTPILGSGGSSRLWKWSGVMVHNTYAVFEPPVSRLFAEYHVFFGDAETGSRTNFLGFGDTTVRLEWNVVPVDNPLTFKFGAIAPANGAPLSFLNADLFVTNARAVVNFRSTNGGLCAFQYESSVPLMAVPATAANGGPGTNAAALGSRVELQLVSLTGPSQASLSFWESGQGQPRFSLPTGALAGTNRILLTENPGASDADPYGCIPGRHLTLSQPGLYCLGFRVVDTSTNGPGGGAIHQPSPLYQVYLQAGLTIASLSRKGTSSTAVFGGEPGKTFYLERCNTPGWIDGTKTVAGPLSGTNRLQTLADPGATEVRGFYRLRAQ